MKKRNILVAALCAGGLMMSALATPSIMATGSHNSSHANDTATHQNNAGEVKVSTVEVKSDKTETKAEVKLAAKIDMQNASKEAKAMEGSVKKPVAQVKFALKDVQQAIKDAVMAAANADTDEAKENVAVELKVTTEKVKDENGNEVEAAVVFDVDSDIVDAILENEEIKTVRFAAESGKVEINRDELKALHENFADGFKVAFADLDDENKDEKEFLFKLFDAEGEEAESFVKDDSKEEKIDVSVVIPWTVENADEANFEAKVGEEKAEVKYDEEKEELTVVIDKPGEINVVRAEDK